jgi:predicted Na+-dependent transporter
LLRRLASFTAGTSGYRPAALLWEIGRKQFLPLSIGMVTVWFAPAITPKVQPALNVLGNVVLTLIMALMLFKMGPALKAITPLVPLAALLIAVGSIAAIQLSVFGDPLVKQTVAICNANRHVGLALLLSGRYLHARNALPAVACYALLAPLVMFVYVKRYLASKRAEATET